MALKCSPSPEARELLLLVPKIALGHQDQLVLALQRFQRFGDARQRLDRMLQHGPAEAQDLLDGLGRHRAARELDRGLDHREGEAF